MDKAGRMRGKGLIHMKIAWKAAVMATVASVVLGTTASHAQPAGDDGFPPRFFRYELYQHPMFDPAYSIAWKAMEPIYKGTEYERRPQTPTDVPTNPYITVSDFDLNGDKMPEIISYPQETAEEYEVLCKDEITCPFFVLEVRDKQVHTLAIIPAVMVDRGDDIVNGYWTLKVYTANKNIPDYKNPQTYVYDRQKDSYVLKASPTPASSAAPGASGP